MSNTRKRARKKTKTKSNVFGLRLNPATRKVLEERAAADGRTPSNYARLILERATGTGAAAQPPAVEAPKPIAAAA